VNQNPTSHIVILAHSGMLLAGNSPDFPDARFIKPSSADSGKYAFAPDPNVGNLNQI
jgi:hypothetical protein